MLIKEQKAYWAKIVGEARENQFKETAWTMDLAIDDETLDTLLKAGMGTKFVKNFNDERGNFIQFKRRSTTAKGEPAKPIRIVDAQGKDWDGKTLIGNGSVLNVNMVLNEATDKQGKKSLKPGLISVQVWDLVPYKAKSSFPTKPATEADPSIPTEDSESW